MSDKYKFCKLPFIRGVFSFVDSMILGMKSLTFSASFFEDDENAEPSGLEKFLDRVFGEKLEALLSTVVIGISFVAALLLFVLFPDSTYTPIMQTLLL